MWHKGSVSTVLNPIFSKKVQGQKHPGRWGIAEHQIPSIKMLFKTNTKSHKHPSIRYLSKSKTQLVNRRKQKWHSIYISFPLMTSHNVLWHQMFYCNIRWCVNSYECNSYGFCFKAPRTHGRVYTIVNAPRTECLVPFTKWYSWVLH